MDMTDPVITGAAVVSSLGPGLNETWEALMEGESGIAPLDSFDASAFPDARAALVKGLDPTDFGVKARELRIMGRHSLMLMKAALDAWEDAGLADRGVPMEGVGFFAGMGMVDHDVDDLLPAVKKSLTPDGRIDYRRFYEGAFREIYPLWPLSMLNNIAFCQVAIRLGIRGENAVFSPHGDSTIHAFYEAAGMIREGKAEMVLAGGVSEEVKPASLARDMWSSR
jgi:3-oxoacyl-(acyl-carrier-protein) synthase